MYREKVTTITVDELNFAVYFEPDDDSTPPWERSDSHGPVSEYTNRKQAAGEIILCNDRNSYFRYYNYQEACRIALNNGWNYEGITGTKHEIAANAAMRDYEYLRSWCNNEWHYIGVTVELLDDDGDGTGITESLYGVEDHGDYWREVAKELCSQIIASCQRMN